MKLPPHPTAARRIFPSRWSLPGFAAVALAFFGFGSASAQPAPSFNITPSTVRMGAFYNGARVRIEGMAPAGSQVVIVLRGDERDEFFNKKGRAGPIWVNTDKVHVARAPSLFLLFASGDVHAMLDRGSIDSYLLDESAIKGRMDCHIHCKCKPAPQVAGAPPLVCTGQEPDPAEGRLLRDEYMALKSAEGSYRMYPGTVRVAESAQGAHYSLDLDWPRKAPPGSYQVEVLACRNRSVISRSVAALQVVEVGFPARIAELARTRSWLYGVIAIVVASLSGFFIDAITSRLRRLGGKPRRVKRETVPPQDSESHPPGSEDIIECDPAHHT